MVVGCKSVVSHDVLLGDPFFVLELALGSEFVKGQVVHCFSQWRNVSSDEFI